MNSVFFNFSLIIFLLFVSCDDQGGPSYGCTDIDACNYDSNAELEDGTCEYPSEDELEGSYCDCTGDTSPDVYDCFGECGGGDFSDCYGVCETGGWSYSDILTKFQSLGCTGCHTGSGGNGSVDLSSYSGIMNSGNYSTGIIITECSQFLNSPILLAVQDGGPMSGYADQDLIDMLTSWISKGAPQQ